MIKAMFLDTVEEQEVDEKLRSASLVKKGENSLQWMQYHHYWS